MNFLRLIGLLMILSGTQESCGVLHRSSLVLVRTFSLLRPTCWFSHKILPGEAVSSFYDVAQSPRAALIGSGRKPIYIPFDRHTAARILRERKENSSKGR